MDNNVFGMTMEGIDNLVDAKLVTEEKEATKLVAKPSCDKLTIFDENLIAVHMKTS